MLGNRSLLTTLLFVLTAAVPGVAPDTPGETATEIKIGNTDAYRNNSVSIGAVIKPAGPENAIGMITAGFVKDPTDPSWKNDAGMNEWRDFMARYMPGADVTDANVVYAYSVSKAMLQVLTQCEGDFRRENIMKQALSLHDLELPTLLPGIKVNTSPTNYRPIQQVQLVKFDGTTWVRFGDVITGGGN